MDVKEYVGPRGISFMAWASVIGAIWFALWTERGFLDTAVLIALVAFVVVGIIAGSLSVKRGERP